PSANQEPEPAGRLLAALLDVRAHEFLGVLLEHLVDLVQDRVDVIGELLVPLLDLFGRLRLCVLDFLGPAAGLALAARVLLCHPGYLRQSGVFPAPELSSPIRALFNRATRYSCCPVRADTRSAAVRARPSRSPTCFLVPRSGSRVGTRCSDSRPGMSKMTESQEAAATDSAYWGRQGPRE